MLKYTPRTEEEVSLLLPKDKYMLTVKKVSVENKKVGDFDFDILSLELEANHNNRNIIIYDSIRLDGSVFSDRKLRHYAYATNFSEDYNDQIFDPKKTIGKKVEANIDIKKDKTGQYPDRNRVLDYLVPKIADEFNDNLTF